MAPTPAARPSRPSTKLIEFTVSSVSATVRMTPSGPSAIEPAPGTVRVNSCRPCSTITPLASTCPASLVRASIPHRSSTAPSSTMMPPAMTTACTSEYRTETRDSAGRFAATRKPAHTPA